MSFFNRSIEDFPENIIADILSRLPVKKVIHCKSVCKNWRELVSDSYFVNVHLSRSPASVMIHHELGESYDVDFDSKLGESFDVDFDSELEDWNEPGALNWLEIKGELDDTHLHHGIVMNPVCRFKCVSKEWHPFLTSDLFRNKHNRLYVDDQQNNNKLLVFSKTKTSFEFTTIDCEVPPSDKDLTPTRHPLPSFEDTTPYDSDILASFHGFMFESF
ncbi:F-box associated domain containing protein [Tanacetum coccineum]|uniref:F-box associated domain containing protein n=1 Tax=Tanacetum coccineum TaxID=301880 RepID=A0ABQ4ZMM1_9ASTR